jgi:subtilisin family serine protease
MMGWLVKRSQVLYSMLIVLIIGYFFGNAKPESKLTALLKEIIIEKGENSTIKVWIYFTDKGTQLGSKIKAVQAKLTPHARKRRLRSRGTNNLVDFKDVPVNQNYIAEIKNSVQKIRNKSRWLNAISVEIIAKKLHEIENFSFVKKIDIVREGRGSRPLPEEEIPSGSRQLNGLKLNYGPSFDQNNQINAIPLHDLGYDGSGVLICMLDAGFNNLQHEALDHLNILHTWDFANGDSIVEDQPGQLGSGNHGTYTLSALAGFEEGQLIGPAYGADFILAKTEITDSAGHFYERHLEEDNWIAGAEWADSLGADIISSSLGYLDQFTNGESNYTWQDMDGNTTIVTIGADIAASRGILVVSSAGNEGPAKPLQNSLNAPSDGDSVACIGAVNSSGNRASFSSMGPTADGRIKPDVMARGVSVISASPVNSVGFVGVSGTSLSCPLAAGAAALVLQVNPTWTNMQVLEALKNTADNASSPNNSYGWGIINAYDAAFYSSSDNGNLISEFELNPVYPNPLTPFNPVTNIEFKISTTGQVNLSAFNNLGQKVAVLTDGLQMAGPHSIKWDTSGLASGVYYLVLKANQGQRVRKLLLLK